MKYGKMAANKADLYNAIYNVCDSNNKATLIETLCKHMLRNSIHSANPDSIFTNHCIKFINIFSTLTDSQQIEKIITVLDQLLPDQDKIFYKSLYTWLTDEKASKERLNRLHQATAVQIAFCREKSGDIEFLDMLIKEKMDANLASHSQQLITLADQELQQLCIEPFYNEMALQVKLISQNTINLRKINNDSKMEALNNAIEPCDKLQALEVIFKLFPTQEEALKFLHENKASIFKLNTSMLNLYAKYASTIDDKKGFLQILNKATTPEDCALMQAVFSQLDASDAKKAISLLDEKGPQSLSINQRMCIIYAFQSKDAKSEDKLNFLKTMIHKNFTRETLINIAALADLIIDRPKFIKALANMNESDNMLTTPFVEIIRLLHKKGITINFEHVEYLSKLKYIRRFAAVINHFPAEAVQTIFEHKNDNSTAVDWVKAFMLQAINHQNKPKLISHVIALIFNLWSFATANPDEVRTKDLLNLNFSELFIKFLNIIDVKNAAPATRFAILGDAKKARKLLGLDRNTDSESSVVTRFVGSFFSNNDNPLPNNASEIYKQLGVVGLTAEGQWIFNNTEDQTNFNRWMRRAELELTTTEDSNRSLIALTSLLQIEEADEDELFLNTSSIVPYKK